MKTTILCVLLAAILAIAAWLLMSNPHDSAEPVHVIDVYPNGNIQAVLEQAAELSGRRTVRVHAGTYRPSSPGQALIYFNARHDGIVLEAAGDVTLTAANPALAAPKAASYPAVVNHVVYFGDGVSRNTVLRGFRITGANGFVDGPADLRPIQTSRDLEASRTYLSQAAEPIEANRQLPKTHYFFTDGGGILVYGRAFPTIDNVQIVGNRVRCVRPACRCSTI